MRITHLIKNLATLGAERLVVKLSKGMRDIDRGSLGSFSLGTSRKPLWV